MRAPATLAATLVLGGCYSVLYDYPEFSGENIAITELARPSSHGLDVGKGEIPFTYALELPDASLTVALDPNVPRTLTIESSVPIAAMSTTHGTAYRRSPLYYVVQWQDSGPDSHAGETLEIRVDLEDRAEPILLAGAIVRWGRTYFPADL